MMAATVRSGQAALVLPTAMAATIISRIERLAALKSEIEHMLKACVKGRIAKCRVIDVLSHQEHCLHNAR